MTDKKIKMVAFDLDGTLLTREKKITSYTKEVLQRAVDKGVIILPATGRPFTGIPIEILKLPGVRYVVSANGARVVDTKSNKVLSEALVSYEYGSRLLEIFKKYDALLEIYYDGIGYAEENKLNNIYHFLPERPMANYILSTRRPVKDVIGMFHEYKRDTDKIQALFADIKERERAVEEVKESGMDVEVTGALFNNIEVNAKGVNKGNALLELGNFLGIQREEIMACGDGDNDMEMLRAAGLGVAMENSKDTVKVCADVITCTNDKDGAAKAIEKYVL